MASNVPSLIVIFIGVVAVAGCLLWAFNVVQEAQDEVYANQTAVDTHYLPLLDELRGYFPVTIIAIITFIGIVLGFIAWDQRFSGGIQ